MNNKIQLNDLIPVNPDEYQKYRLHFAKPVFDKETGNRYFPLQVLHNQLFEADNDDWDQWQTHMHNSKGERFPSDFVITFAQYPDNSDTFLFGGVFKIIDRDKTNDKYNIEWQSEYEKYVGRLVVKVKLEARSVYRKLDNLFPKVLIKEILPSPFYTSKKFPGYKKLDLTYDKLAEIDHGYLRDWKQVLQNIEGVYLITDEKNSKLYVGSATGVKGIWGRWISYYNSLTGGNKGLEELNEESKKKFDENYIKQNFHFSILEAYALGSIGREKIIERESMWKNRLRSRGTGYNKN